MLELIMLMQANGGQPWYESGRIILSAIVGLYAVVITFLTANTMRKSKTAEIWKGERDAAIAKAERLDAENKRLALENTDLMTRTDLKSIIETSNTLMQLATESLELTRMNQIDTHKFERENTETHFKLVETLDGVKETIKQMVVMMNETREETARHFKDDRDSGELNRKALETINESLKEARKT